MLTMTIPMFAAAPSHATSDSDAERCAPAAVVGGNSAAAVAAILRVHGVDEPAQGCPAVSAHVREADDGLHVSIVDSAGRKSERRASTAAAAATIVESWAREEVANALLVPRAMGPVVPDIAVDVPAPPPPDPWVRLDVNAETSVAFDGSVWPGANAGACFQFGPVCAGLFGRAGIDSSTTGASADKETGRVALDGLIGVDTAFDVAGLSLRPGGYVGAGWMQSRNSPVWGAEATNNVEVDGGGMRVGARAVLGVPINDSFAVNVSLGADLALLAHTQPFVAEGEGIAGEPLGFVRLGLGFGARR